MSITDKTMADGQEFIGQAAVDVGLTDGVTTFDAVIGGLRKKSLRHYRNQWIIPTVINLSCWALRPI